MSSGTGNIKVQATADTVFMRLMTVEFHTFIEITIDQAEKIHAELGKAVAEAKAFEPGAKPFVEWDV